LWDIFAIANRSLLTVNEAQNYDFIFKESLSCIGFDFCTDQLLVIKQKQGFFKADLL